MTTVGKNIAILPARGGSKRIPGKNIRSFNGRPIMAWPLAAARSSGLFDVIHVSTDSPEIARVATELGFAPEFSRPPEFAGDTVPMRPVIRHVLDAYAERGRTFDRAFVLFPCAPLLSADELRGAMRTYDESAGRHDLLTVAPFPVPVEWAFRMGDGGALVPLHPESLTQRSQDLETSFYETGTFAIFNPERVRADGPATANYIGYRIPRECAIDIDTEEDWIMAEHVHGALRAAGKL